MKNKMWKAFGLLGLLASLSLVTPAKTYAAEIAVETSTTLYAKMDVPVSVLDTAKTDATILSKTEEGKTYEVVEPPKDGWVKIKISEGQGYIKSSSATMIEKSVEKAVMYMAV